MPMRGVLYFARLYGKIIAQNNINIYSSSSKKFPFPQHIVFYNGTENQPDRTVLRLSDLFERSGEGKTPALECITVMLNINYGHNRALLEKCRRLKEYAIFVDRVRRNLKAGKPLEEAIMQTGTMFRNNYFMIFTRPIVDVFVFLILISFLWPVFIKRVKKRAEAEQ